MKKITLLIFIYLYAIACLGVEKAKLNPKKVKLSSKLVLEEVLKSVIKHHPQVLKSLEQIKSSEAKEQNAQGAFDLTIQGKIEQRSGNYDGDYQDLSLVKPFGSFNGKVFTGFRRSENSFPDYDGKLETMNAGEWRAGLELSLLRYRNMDQRRLKLFNNKINKDRAKTLYNQIIEQLKFYTYEKYWYWILSARVVNIYRELLNISIRQDKAIRQRVQKGDLAQIYIVENQQYILKRKKQVAKAQQDFINQSLQLSLLYRDKEGNPKIPDMSQVPETEFDIEYIKNFTDKKIMKMIVQSKDIKLYDQKIEQLDNKIIYAENLLKPKLDLSLQVSQDQGREVYGLDKEDRRMLVSLEIPIERNLGKGKVQTYKSQKRIQGFKRQFLVEKFKAKINTLLIKLKATAQVINLGKKEIVMAEKLENAEREKFKSGQSDFFIVNLREQNTVNAKVSLMRSEQKYATLYSRYQLILNGVYQSLK